MGMTQRQKRASFQLSYALAMVDNLKRFETPKSHLWNKLNNLEDHLGRVLDCYRIEHFHMTDLKKASELFGVLDNKIAEMYPVKGSKREDGDTVCESEQGDGGGTQAACAAG